MSLFHHLLALVGLQVATRSPSVPAQPRAMKPDEIRIANERKTQAFTELSAATRAIKKSAETHNLVNLPGLDGHRESRVFNRNLPAPPPGVIPNGAGKPKLANDSNINQLQTWGTSYGWAGYGFMGYALLSDLAQIPEFRKPSEIIANEMTREWGKFASKSDDDDKSDRIKELTSEFERLNVQETFRRAYEMDNFFGIGHILIDIGAADDELAKPLGGKLLKAKIAKGKPVEALRCVEPIWMYPNQYNSIDPTADDFYRPQTWFVLSIEVNSSRMLSFNSRPVPDILKPQYLFGGVALTQLLYPYVQNWLGTRQSVSNMISSFSTMVLEVDMDQMMNPGGAEMLLTRGQFYNMGRDNLGLFIIDKNKEGFTNVSAPLGSLDKLQAQAQEQMAGIAGIPLVKLFGITPSGLNASSDGEIRAFYDTIASLQERIGTPNIDKLKNIVMITLWGEVDEDIIWHWEPLWSLDEEKRAAVRKTEADTAKTYIDSGVLAPEEVRAAVAADESSSYAAIDVGNAPDLQGEEEEGLEPEGGRPQPQDVESETRQEDDEHSEDDQGPFSRDSVLLGLDAQSLELASVLGLIYDEAKFDEGKHPRGQPGNAGQFGPGGGAGEAKPKAAPTGFNAAMKAMGTLNKGQKALAHVAMHHLLGNHDVKASEQSTNFVTAMKLLSTKTPKEKKAFADKLIDVLAKGPEGIKEAIKEGEAVQKPDAVAKAKESLADKAEQIKAGMLADIPTGSVSGTAEHFGYEMDHKTKGVVYTKGSSALQLTSGGDWVVQTPGFQTKEGNGGKALAALLTGSKSEWEKLGVKSSSKKVETSTPDDFGTKNQPTHAKLRTEIAKARPVPSSAEESAIQSYKGSGYVSMNDKLRHGGEHTAGTKQIQKWLDRAEMPVDAVLHRGISGEYAKILRSVSDVGTVFKDRGFISTTTDPGFAKGWKGGNANAMTMEISVKKGQKAAAIRPADHSDGEHEIVVQCGSKLKVTHFDWEAKHMKCELVQD